jgi:hypothetical protein
MGIIIVIRLGEGRVDGSRQERLVIVGSIRGTVEQTGYMCVCVCVSKHRNEERI